MKYYLDTEFLEGTQKKSFLGFRYGETKPTIDLISIGVVCEDGRTYYAVSSDFNLEEVWYRIQKTTGSEEPLTYWHRENILLPIYQEYVSGDNRNRIPFTIQGMKEVIKRHGKPNSVIAEDIKEFCYLYIWTQDFPVVNFDPISFYGYYSSYDWVVFCQLYGIMMNLPKYFPWYIHDLKAELDTELKHWEDYKARYRDPFTLKLVNKIAEISWYPAPNKEHHARYDAWWIKELHSFVKKVKARR